MKLTVLLSIFVLQAFIFANEFYLFDEKDTVDPSVYTNYKFNKFKAVYSIFPEEQRKAAFGFTRFLNKKAGFFAEAAVTEQGNKFSERSEFCAGLAYKFTKRSWTWVFLGNLGLSVNDDVKDLNGDSKGFRLNHIIGRFTTEYIFKNGFGLDFSMTARLPIEFDLNDGMSPIHSIGVIYQF